ncbi:hypothetical protein [Nocardioides sp. Soil805]|uniref:hypothetical protein n=1 Tax=Nocardioides sp. Soil805 TaxID=1736416 RepID=UPI0007032343|nr:hypothetical protein [Nocardioides sp. Soil805]KRF36857.1 hypothetical protein ASG94_05515 [Nocardioides sp. Soil805]
MSWRSWGLAVVVVGALAGCQRGQAPAHPLEPAVSSTSTTSAPSAAPETPGQAAGPLTIADPRITESSGLALSHVHDGVLYTHNDRGDTAALFAVDSNGTRAVLRLDAPALDWEDMAASPDGRLWVADTGDNDEVRESVTIEVVEEPEVLVSASLVTTSYELVYPDGPHDAEALLVDPRDLRVYLVTKEPDGGTIYAAPAQLDPDRPNRLRAVATAPPNISAGDFASDGGTFALRNQGKVFFYGEIGGAPTMVTPPSQPQGESLTFDADGTHVLLGSEGANSEVIQVAVPGAGR